jgi:hypothetical protein
MPAILSDNYISLDLMHTSLLIIQFKITLTQNDVSQALLQAHLAQCTH